jgi:hypothetical protein
MNTEMSDMVTESPDYEMTDVGDRYGLNHLRTSTNASSGVLSNPGTGYQNQLHTYLDETYNESEPTTYLAPQHPFAGSDELSVQGNHIQDVTAYDEASAAWPLAHPHLGSYVLTQDGALHLQDSLDVFNHQLPVPTNHQSQSFNYALSQRAGLTQPSQNNLHFSSLSKAIAAMPYRDYWRPVTDHTIPTNDLQRQQWVLLLLNAINNTTDVCDAQGLVFQNRWYKPGVGPSTFYSAESKEILAWDILALVEALHREGGSALVAFNQQFWTQAKKEKHWTFSERMEKITELLAISKARCDKLLAGAGLQSVVSRPEDLIKTTRSNGVQNGKRQRILEVGRAAKKARIV